MRIRTLGLALLIVAAAACSNPLDVKPAGSIPEATAISDPASAQAALAGAYSALQSLSYYGEDFPVVEDLSSDNTDHVGTFQSLESIDQNRIRADDPTIGGIWAAIYDAINRDNEIIAKVPAVQGLDTTTRNEIVGEAYFLRALNYHNLVKLFAGVPLRLKPATSLADAASATRASVSDVYKQILNDLDSAQALISDSSQTRQASAGAVQALRARVLLYKGDWAGADAAASAVEAMGYSLATNYSDLFSETGNDTPEDIFRIIFTPQQFNNLSYYYLTKGLGGRYEVRPTRDLMHAYDPNYNPDSSIDQYNPTDLRGQWNISIAGSRVYGSKYRSTQGTEHLHVIRFAEVILIRAEALARMNDLTDAVTEYNRVRVRAGLSPHVLGVDVTTQQDVINAIVNERRLELAFEGDRWPDLVRLGIAASLLGIPQYQTLYPIPQRELDVTPGLTQNPGY